MLKELKFVQGAIAKKNFDPTLMHFLIRGGRVWGFNGIITLSSPIQCDLDIAPHAGQFLKALLACEEATSLHLTPQGQLALRSGSFRTLVDCVRHEEHKAPPPSGSFIELNGSLLAAIKKLDPFIAFDASRPWACGILFDGRSAFATNNIVVVEYWLGYDFPVRVNIPSQAVNELLRINEEPLGLQVREDQLTFYYKDHRWLTTKTSALDWPNVPAALDRLDLSNLEEPPPGIWSAVEKIKPFADDMGRVHFKGDQLATSLDVQATVIDFPGLPKTGIYNAEQLINVGAVATRFDFTKYPLGVPFVGENIRGMIAGIRS